MADERPKREDYGDLHQWAQAVQRWNDQMGVNSDDLIEQWNKERKNA